MRRIHLLLLCLLPVFSGLAQTKPALEISVIPKPVSIEARPGAFTLNAETRVYYPKGKADWELAAQYFMALVQTATGWPLSAQVMKKPLSVSRENSIYFIHDETVAAAEAYRLDVSAGQIYIRASTAAGAFYGLQTLRQLFPPAFNAPAPPAQKTVWTAPACHIEDAPRFGHRGLMLDVGRHFFPVEFVKRFIDLLAVHKFNTFHWHLTDDQGWRIEIPKYPRLTTVGACRDETLVGHYSDQPWKFDGKKHCGFYTRAEVKSVIEHARKRFVTIVPEIDMPGHALAALSAYPELGCTGGPYETAKIWGVHDEVFCAGNDKTLAFLSDVLDEVCTLFPGQYVHVGGDECPKTRWKSCPKCQKRMRENGLKDEHELQSFVIRRAGETLARHGKKLIGWDEILEGGLPPAATVMSWRGIEGGIAAARAGHDVVMSPTDNCYLDYYQSDPEGEPLAIGGYLPLQKVYAYEPVPDVLTPQEARHILGVQGNIWTEYLQTPETVEYMTWPRAAAIAETGWTSAGAKNYQDFSARLKRHFQRLEKMQVGHAKSFFDVTASFPGAKVSLECADPGMAIWYTFDQSEPDPKTALLYTGKPFGIKQAATVKAAAFDGERKMSKTATFRYIFHKASGKPYTLTVQPNKFTGGETYGLTNGVEGPMKKWNAWVALPGADLDPVIDLGEPTAVSRVTTHFVNGKDSWIYPPRAVEVFVSEDGKTFQSVGRQEINAEAMSGYSVETVSISFPESKARFVKLVATNFGPIPPTAAGAGNGAWVFLDEVIVE